MAEAAGAALIGRVRFLFIICPGAGKGTIFREKEGADGWHSGKGFITVTMIC